MNSELERLLLRSLKQDGASRSQLRPYLLRNANLSWQASAESAGPNAVKNASLHTASFFWLTPAKPFG